MRASESQAKHKWAFTLAELLISLAILGVIATFTIPKILNSSQSNQFNSNALEVASVLSNIHHIFLLEGKASYAISVSDLKNKLNVVRESTSTADGTHDGGFWTCSDAASYNQACLILHNGGCLQIIPYYQMGVPYQIFTFDPDNAGPASRVNFFMDAQGRLTSGSTKGFTIYGPPSRFDEDPDWFHWS